MKKRRQAADRTDRTQQSARQIENNGQERRRPRRRSWGTAGRVIGTILLVFVLTAAIFAGIFSAYINSSMRGRVEVYLDEFETKVSTELYYQEPSSGEWTMYHTLFLDSENRIWADLEQIPKDLQKAVVAIEDKRFYTHKGVDWHGTARAIFSTIFGGSVQGGSTITQQLVKNVTGDNQNTVKRKVMEIYRAQELEKRYEKDEILEAYLNEVYFGYSCYGVVTASLKYFNKDVSELSLAECASLVAITNNPSLYDPLQTDWGLENNRTRQLLVLGAMLEQGKIDQAAYDAAKEENVVFSNGYTILGDRVDVDTDKKDDTDADGGDEQPEEETETATSSQSYFTDAVIEDVAAALVEKYGLKPMAKLISWGQGGVDPKIMGVGPVVASRNAMKKAGVTIDDIDLVEANEAFAAQSIAVARELHFDMSKVNVNGGAIALGHPVGASGARIIVTLLHEMQKRPEAKKGLATLCIGGGMGTAVVFEKC